MITKDGKLKIVEDFVVDEQLPKYESVRAKPGDLNLFDDGRGGIVFRNPRRISVEMMEPPPSRKPWYKRWFTKSEPAPTMSIPEFFANVKLSADELVIVQKRSAGYERALLNAKQAGQTALCEMLTDGLNAFKMEAQLAALGMTKYVTEGTVVDFYKQSPKGVRLDWLHNFTRALPQDVLDRKLRADELHIFDNYAVMHYDPEAKSYSETEKEKAARKDPILFGLIKGKRVLYFVGDWVDEHCDLTLDQIAEAMGKDAVVETATPGAAL